MEASGKLVDIASGAAHRFETNAQGEYTFTGLPMGHYRIEVRRIGFATQSLLLDVTDSAPVTRTITMPLLRASTQVDVIANDLLARACLIAGRNLTRDEWNTYLPRQPYRKTCDQWPEGN